MSREVLSDPAPRPGFFGKLPVTGDFLSRGLPATFRRQWDTWVTRNLMRRDPWPEGGLRFCLSSGGRVAAGVLVPGADSAGRQFPLSLILIGQTLPSPREMDPWCDAALAAARPALAGVADADDLQDALEALTPPDAPAFSNRGMLIWTARLAPTHCDISEPERVLTRAFSVNYC